LTVARIVDYNVYAAKVGDGGCEGLFDLFTRGDVETELEDSLLVGEVREGAD
jgi:hypothetical protein